MKTNLIMAAFLAITGIYPTLGFPSETPPRQVRTITVATDATCPPMEMIDENQQIVGFDIDFMKAVAKESGFLVVFKNDVWDRIFTGVSDNRYDAIISSVNIIDQHDAKYDFSLPYINVGQILIVPKTETATKIANLAGKKVGAQIGTIGAQEVKKNAGVELKTYDKVSLAFEDLAAGRIAGVVCDEPIGIFYALQKKENSSKFKIADQPFAKEPYGIVVKKEWSKELLSLINKGILAVKQKKIDEQLRKKWLQ